MSSTPTIPSNTVISTDIAWLKTHIIVIFGAILLTGGIVMGSAYEINNIVERHDAAKAAVDDARFAQLEKDNADLRAQYAQDKQESAARDAQQMQVIANLIQQRAAEHAQTDKQVKKDATLDIQQATSRLAQQTDAQPGDITVSGNTAVLSLPITRKITQDEDNFLQATHDVANLQAQLAAQQTITADAKQNFADAEKIIQSDGQVLAQQVKKDNDECDLKVAKARKHGFWFSVATFVGGIITRNVI